MGIESFGAYIQKRFNKCIGSNKPKNICSLFIDANGIFYGAVAQIIPSKLSAKEEAKLEALGKEKIEEKVIKKCQEILENIIIQFKPSHNLIVAVDGMANSAKMNQQKSRRYIKKSPEEIKFFDTRVFTPGTTIMIKIDKLLEKMIKNIDDIPNVIYSSHMVPGEAEHKIFDLIRANKIIPSSGNHLLHGADSDLVVISLLSKLSNIFVYRDNISLFYDINKFKELVKEKMQSKSEDQIIYQDFSLLTYFIGNDFLPRFPNLPSVVPTMDILVKVYRKVDRAMTNEEGDIIWNNFYHLLNCLDKWKRNDYGLYENNFINPLEYPYRILHESVNLRDINGKVVDANYDSSLHTIEFDLKKFGSLWYNKQFEPKSSKLKKNYKDGEYFTTRDIVKMVIKFLQTFQWVLKYYLLGPEKVPNSFFYPYKYTPLSISVINYMKLLMQQNKIKMLNNVMSAKNYDFHVVHQLLMVLPPDKLDLIPDNFHEIYRTALASVSPVDFPDPQPEGTDAFHVIKPNIPPINPGLTVDACKGHTIPSELRNRETLIISNKVNQVLDLPDEDYKVKETILM